MAETLDDIAASAGTLFEDQRCASAVGTVGVRLPCRGLHAEVERADPKSLG